MISALLTATQTFTHISPLTNSLLSIECIIPTPNTKFKLYPTITFRTSASSANGRLLFEQLITYGAQIGVISFNDAHMIPALLGMIT
jgi:hypothetical protein